MQKVTLRNWSIVRRGNDPYVPPECQTWVFAGEVYNHPDSHLKDGDKVVTNVPVEVNMQAETFITKSGSRYCLEGPPSTEWTAWMAKRRPPIVRVCGNAVVHGFAGMP